MLKYVIYYLVVKEYCRKSKRCYFNADRFLKLLQYNILKNTKINYCFFDNVKAHTANTVLDKIK